MNFLMVNEALTLRSFSLRDATILFDLVYTNKSFLSPWMSWVNQYNNIEDARAFIRFCTKNYQEGLGYSFGIWKGDDLLGEVSFTALDKINDVASIGYWLGQAYTGQGIVHQSLETLMQFGYNQLGINRMEIKVSTANIASIRVAKSLGFVQEGVLSSAGKNASGYHDVILFSKLKI